MHASIARSHSSSLESNQHSHIPARPIDECLHIAELELYPHKGEFINYDVDTTYVMAFTVRNRSSTTQTLRFIPPQAATQAFRLVNHSSARLAPGMERKIDVEFSTHVVEDYQDVFVVLTERGERVAVPLVAQSAPALEMESVVNLGVVEHTRVNLTHPYVIKNRGRREALVTFVVPPGTENILSFHPPIALAKPLADTKVQIEVVGAGIGRFQWAVEVQIDAEEQVRSLNVMLDVVDCRSRLVDLVTGEEAVSVIFPRVYAGSKEKHELLMANGSEVGVSFAFQLANELVAKDAPPFRFSPEQGVLGPKEHRKVAVIFEPPMSYVRKGWSHVHTGVEEEDGAGPGEASRSVTSRREEAVKFEGLFSLLFVETEEIHSFHVVGESMETQAGISRSVLDFGTCALTDYRDEVITIRNEVDELPLHFKFDKVAAFRVRPSEGSVPPSGSSEVVLTFHPHRPGNVTEKVKLILNHSVRRTLTLVGKGVVEPGRRKKLIGGVHALPEDFQQPLQPPREERGSDAFAERLRLAAAPPPRPTAAEQGLAVDLGMKPAEGLAVPRPSQRVQQKELREEDEALRSSPSAHVAPMSFDVKSLIRRRFNDAPENAVERRDCRRALLPMDLLKVVAPIKTLQFDQITIGTSAMRPFYLYNGTSAAILVVMPADDAYPELSFEPRSQVIPPNRIAAFDVSLCSSHIQTCQQIVTFTVNHHHPMRLTVQADVVPVEVLLSYGEVELRFSEFTDEPITRTTITLSNNGNCDASFWWKLPPKAPFSIEPSEGTMFPMSKLIAQITFSPPQGVLSFTCDAYLAVEGASQDKKLQLSGLVEPANCAWAKLLVKNSGEAQVDLRRIPAGKGSSAMVNIVNNGSSNAFYSFDSLPEWLIISPACGRISAGEMEDILVTVKSDKVENISQMISCHVRGMRRPLRMQLTANVVAPPVVVPKGAGGEVVLSCGDVYLYYEKQHSLSVKNNGDVPAVIVIDVSEYFPDVRAWWTGAPSSVPPLGEAEALAALTPRLRGGGGPQPVSFAESEPDFTISDTQSVSGDGGKKGAKSGLATADVSTIGSPLSSAATGVYTVIIEPNTEEVITLGYRPTSRALQNQQPPSSPTSSGMQVFSPSVAAASRRHRLPIRWRQIGADDVLHALPPLFITASPLVPKIELERRVLKFPSNVVGRPPRVQHFTIRNLSRETLRWGIQSGSTAPVLREGNSVNTPPPASLTSMTSTASSALRFLVEPTTGSIPPCGTVKVSVSFVSQDVGHFVESLQVYVDDAPHKPCAVVTASATAIKPRLVLDRPTIVFPPVPLGAVVKDTIQIYNEGFESIHLEYHGESQPLVAVNFPKGNTLLSTQLRKVPVEIQFSSPKPITLNTSLLISSNRGETVEVRLCATAINTIFLTAPYVSYRESMSAIAPASVPASPVGRSSEYSNAVVGNSLLPCPFMFREQRPNTVVSIAPHDKVRGIGLNAGGGNSGGGGASAANAADADPFDAVDALVKSVLGRGAVVDFVSRWFNIMLLPSPVENIVEAVQSSHGGVLSDIIVRLFGKRPGPVNPNAKGGGNSNNNTSPRRPKAIPTGSPSTAVNAAGGSSSNVPAKSSANPRIPERSPSSAQARLKSLSSLQMVLRFLEFYGCCVHHVQEKYLLQYDEYREFMLEGGDAAGGALVSAAAAASSAAAASILMGSHHQPLSPDAFAEKNTQNWVIVLLEVIRVFYFSRFTSTALIQQAKDMGNAYIPVELWEQSASALKETLTRSNVYSSPESLLLVWVRSCVENYCTRPGSAFATAQKIRVSCFVDLRDARAFISAILVYCPVLQNFFFGSASSYTVAPNPTTAADHEANAAALLASLTELAVPQVPSTRAFLEMTEVELALFASILMSYLPKFMSTEVVTFEGKLLSPITHTINITSTSSKVRLYRVWIENPLFQASKKEVVVPPRGSVPLEITFLPRYNRIVKGRCLMVDQTPVPLEEHAPLVFALHAAPNMEPTKVFDISTHLYEPLLYDIMVENPFQQDCVVSVRISQRGRGTSSRNSQSISMSPSPAVESIRRRRSSVQHQQLQELQQYQQQHQQAAGRGGKIALEADTRAGGIDFIEGEFSKPFSSSPFFVYTDVLPLRRGENAKLPIHFIPLTRGVYTLKITFRDEREGEFSYVVKGTCTDPKPSDTMDFRTELEEPCELGLTVRNTNAAVERSLRLFEDKCRQFHRELPPMTLDWNVNTYTVEFLNDKLEGPNTFFSPVAPDGEEDVAAVAASSGTGVDHPERYQLKVEGPSTIYHFKFMPKYPGSYTGVIRLTSPIDVRLIRFNGECVPRGQRLQLNFHCPARQSITQDLTITNASDKDWLLSATLEGDAFTGAKELRVPKGKKKDYAIKYSPPWITESREDVGKLVLLNSGTGQRHTYTLTGTADEPLSEDTIYVECRAREHRSIVLTIPNVATHDCTYHIETDLPFTEGEASVIIPRDSFVKYTLNFFPAVGGTYMGKVFFRSHQGLYVWFLVTVCVTPPEKEGSVEFRTDVRTSVVADITMRNPMSKAMSFFVRRFGIGLYGENTLTIDPQSSAVYNCIFVPTNPGEMEGRLSFCNDEVGEFWYELKMFVKESCPEVLEFSSPLGVPTTARVKLANTTETECALQLTNTNPNNFSVSPSLLVIPANRELLVDISYTPSSIGKPQEASLTFSHHLLDQWQYSLKGTGLPPAQQKPTTCVCEMGTSTALSLSFVNALEVESRMSVRLLENSRNFHVKRGIDGPVAAGATGTVVVVYAPHDVGQHHTTLEVRPEVARLSPEYDVVWSFPIEANAEWRESATPLRFRCTARKQHEEVVMLPAPGLTREEKMHATISFEPDPNQHYLSAVHASFMCSLDLEDPTPDAFKVQIKFTPLRSMAASGDLRVRRGNGGSWRYRVYLEASPAPLDDTIIMCSAYRSTSSVSFDLYNVFSYKSSFAAYLTSESSKDFAVVPTHGVLLPFIRGQKNSGSAAATTLRINFTPTTRVPQVEGVVVVDTEDMQWSFKVVGKLDREKGRK